ncbi:MAG: DNA-binding protein WhiA [Clostridia bacterium]|nr:DNA-binding protein WhiA [Clostridia bacterium]
MSSFCETFKAELCGLTVKSSCCRKALLYGLLIGAEKDRNGQISVTYPFIRTPEGVPDPAALAVSLIRKQLGREAGVREETRGAHRYRIVTFLSSQAADILEEMSRAEGGADVSGDMIAEEAVGFRCPLCAAHFLRGAFLAAGSVSDPNKSAHMEMRVPADGRTECVAALWNISGILPALTVRGGECGIYFKKLESIQEAMTCIGGVQSVFALINASMVHDLAEDETRATNCMAANIGRSVSAGQRYIAAIRDLEAWGLINTLPPELQETAQLRILHDDLSMTELAALHQPEITKSGLNHRLQKLLDVRDREKSNHGG